MGVIKNLITGGPKPVAPPLPPPPPNAPQAPSGGPAASSAGASGMGSTLMTSPQGLIKPATTAKKSLMGE